MFKKQLSSGCIDENKKEYIQNGGKLFFHNIIYRIVLPSIIFALVEFFPKKIVRGQKISFVDLMMETIGGGTYWFTSALAVSEVLILIMLLLRKRSVWNYVLLCICVYLVGVFLFVRNSCLESYPNLWAYKQGFLATLFLGLGGLYWKYENVCDLFVRRYRWVILLIVYLLIELLFDGQAHVLISMLSLNWLGVISSCLSILLLITFCKALSPIRVLTYIGKYSLGFYFLSGALPIVLSVIGNKVHLQPLYCFMFVFFGSIICALIITYFLNKYVPWIFDFRRI